MSKSLAIVGGDLSIQNRAYQTVSGKDKLIQDLRNWILEPLGTDPATPNFGTRLDGVVSDTEEFSGVIGGMITQQIIDELKAEIIDMLETYQALQIAKMQSEVVTYDGQTTLDPDEVIQSIDSIDAVQAADTIIIQIVLTTFSASSIQITIPVQR